MTQYDEIIETETSSVKRIYDVLTMCPDSATPALEAFVNLQYCAQRSLDAPARLLRDHGLTSQQFNVLKLLYDSDTGLALSEINAGMFFRDSDVSRLLDKLVVQGFAERVRSDQDKRIVLGRITDAGRNAVDRLKPALITLHEELFGRLTEDELRQLTLLLEILWQAEEDLPPERQTRSATTTTSTTNDTATTRSA